MTQSLLHFPGQCAARYQYGLIAIDMAPGGVSAGAQKVGFEPVAGGGRMFGDEYVDALRALLVRFRLRQRKCCVSVPLALSHVATIRLSSMRRAELRRVIGQDGFWRARLGLAGSPKEKFYGYWRASPAGHGYHVCLVAMMCDDVADLLCCVRRAGLCPVSLAVIFPQPDGVVGDTTTVWLDGAFPCVISNREGRLAVQALPDKETLTAGKITPYLPNDTGAVKWVCAESDPQSPSLRELALRYGDAEADIRTPFQALEVTPTVRMDNDGAQSATAEFSLARVCLLRSALFFRSDFLRHKHRRFIAMMKPDTGDKTQVNPRGLWLFCAGYVCLLVVMTAALHTAVRQHEYKLRAVVGAEQKILDAHQAALQRVKKVRHEVEEYKHVNRRRSDFERRQRDGAYFLRKLGALVPDDIRLTRLDFNLSPGEHKPTLKMTGVADSVNAVTRFVARLRAIYATESTTSLQSSAIDDGPLGQVSLREARRDPNGGTATNFTIEYRHRMTEGG